MSDGSSEVQTVSGGSVAETYLVDVPGLNGDDFAVLSATAQHTMQRYGQDSTIGSAQVIEETRVLQGQFRVVMGSRSDYGKCPSGAHWAGQVHDTWS
jgi:hypothetical protein